MISRVQRPTASRWSRRAATSTAALSVATSAMLMPMPKSGREILRRDAQPSSSTRLPPLTHDDVGHDVLGARDVPHDPRERVEILARAYPHLLVRETGEGALGERALVAVHGC